MNKFLLKFWRPGCTPCSVLDNQLKQLDIKYTDINIVENTELTFEYNIRSVPTLLLLDSENNVLESYVYPKQEDLVLIKEALNE